MRRANWGLRTATHGIEAVGDAMPSPSGDRIEIVLRELGGFIWIQITFLIIFIRMVLSSIATAGSTGGAATLEAQDRFQSFPVFFAAPVADRAI